MRKFMVATFSFLVIFYFAFAEISGPVGGIAPITVNLQPDAFPGSSLADPDGEESLDLLHMPAIVSFGSETLATSDRNINQPLAPGRTVATVGAPDERLTALRQLGDLNMAQLYTALWQTIEDEALDAADFQEFVLATLEARGEDVPGEVLAALVQTAPTSALRLNALRLLAEACQELSIGPFNQALDDPDPHIRQFALAFFEELNANGLLVAVADAVLDPNPNVRMAAFSTLEEMYEFAPVWEIADSVLDDPDPQIRKRALELLTYGDHQAAIDRLVLALGDPDPGISELAGELLAEFEQGPS